MNGSGGRVVEERGGQAKKGVKAGGSKVTEEKEKLTKKTGKKEEGM